MSYKKVSALYLLTILFFIIVWYAQGSYLLSDRSKSTLYYLNNSVSGYSSLLAYSIFYPIPFLFLYNQLFLKEKQVTVIRRETREKLYSTLILRVMIAAVLFTLLLTIVNLSLSLAYFGIDLVLHGNFLKVGFVNAISVTLFFSIIGNIYVVLSTVIRKSSLAMFSTFILFSVLFFLHKLVFQDKFWTVYLELSAFEVFYNYSIPIAGILFGSIKVFLVFLFVFMSGFLIFSRKDLYYD